MISPTLALVLVLVLVYVWCSSPRTQEKFSGPGTLVTKISDLDGYWRYTLISYVNGFWKLTGDGDIPKEVWYHRVKHKDGVSTMYNNQGKPREHHRLKLDKGQLILPKQIGGAKSVGPVLTNRYTIELPGKHPQRAVVVRVPPW
jgi:hypothetical protein